jgi:hypothetical protein
MQHLARFIVSTLIKWPVGSIMMNDFNKNPVFIFVLLVIACCGCENTINDYIDSRIYAPKKLLCHSWIKTSELHYPPNIIPNIFNSYMPCAKDNEYKYDSDGYYELNQGGSSCYSTQPFLIENGSWAFQQNETAIKTTLNNGKIRLYNIVALDTNYNFITSYIDSSSGTSVTVKETFSRR